MRLLPSTHCCALVRPGVERPALGSIEHWFGISCRRRRRTCVSEAVIARIQTVRPFPTLGCDGGLHRRARRQEPFGGRAALRLGVAMTDLTSTRGGRRTEIISSPGVPESLRHRGGIPRLRPDATLFAALGGTAGVHRLV